MRPLFPYYGSKWSMARHYPAPVGQVIEPFAGAAGYSTFYNVPNARLIDADPIIVGVWQYLLRVTPAEIMALPEGNGLSAFQSTTDIGDKERPMRNYFLTGPALVTMILVCLACLKYLGS